MDQSTRNKLRNVVTKCRKLLEEAIREQLQGKFGIHQSKKNEVKIEDDLKMTHLNEEEMGHRRELLDHLNHIVAKGFNRGDGLDQLIREIAFTHLNRFCAYKMMEARNVYIGGKKFRDAVGRGINSSGFKFYLGNHSDDEKLYLSGKQDIAYRHYLDWLCEKLSEEIGVLFDVNDPANRIYPPQRVIDDVFGQINDDGLKEIWAEDETIGWVYQYFTPKDIRDKARKESQAPRNSDELAFRNQFFTPRYVVEFLTDNTLGRIWYEMRRGDTALNERCNYLIRRPNEIFLNVEQEPPKDSENIREDLSQEDLLRQPVYVSHRPKKDPREIKILDPACGSGHFLLYCFDLLLVIYEEAYADSEISEALRLDYPDREAFLRNVPCLILSHNLHGIDIDLRATQIAALALWLRCQRGYSELGFKNGDRPRIIRSNIVAAEPMPGETDLLKDFAATLKPKVLGQLVELVFEKMKLAAEAGSLLRIEQEIRDLSVAAKGAYRKELELQEKDDAYLPGMAPLREPALFDFSDMTDGDFWDRAEHEIVNALKRYTEKALDGRGFRRRLFAEDAARGFSFIDVCRKKFDVVLMNPPFGAEIPVAREYISQQYPLSKHDLCASFVERFLDLLPADGTLGAITTRTALFAQTFSEWRNRILGANQFLIVADLGYGVLDAMVETAMYVIQNTPPRYRTTTVFITALTDIDKKLKLEQALGIPGPDLHYRPQSAFSDILGNPMAYWVPSSLLAYFRKLKSFVERGGVVKVGIQSGDDFRFFRLVWEIPFHLIFTEMSHKNGHVGSAKWLPLAKGGEYSPWWDDIHLVVKWENNGHEIRNHPSARPQNTESFYRPGLTYPYRTTSGFGLRVLPAGCGFSVGGWGLFPPSGYTNQEVLAVYNTRVARYFMEVLLGQGDSSVSGSAARNHGAEAVGGIPFPGPHCNSALKQTVNKLVSVWRSNVVDETSVDFCRPRLAITECGSLLLAASAAWANKCSILKDIAELSFNVEKTVYDAYQMTPAQQNTIAIEEGVHPCEYPPRDIDSSKIIDLFRLSTDELIARAQSSCGSKRYVVKKSYSVERHVDLICHVLNVHPSTVIDAISEIDPRSLPDLGNWTSELVGYSIGVAMGRWDARLIVATWEEGPHSDPFSAIPVCPNGMIQDLDNMSLGQPRDYPLAVSGDGILLDEPEHAHDVVRHVRNVLDLIYKHDIETIENEASEILGVRKLRDYFRKPGNEGFWMDHVKRYSKSRRKAPIYWYLRSSKGNYGIWLYYHRLDKDLFLKALVNYVEPKIRLEEEQLKDLRAQKAALGTSGSAAKKMEKRIDSQEQFLLELQDFEEKLRRAAELHLEPDLNDGVVLNIAPLHELVPWKEAKKYWDELLDGKYEWSSIGKQLRDKGMVKK